MHNNIESKKNIEIEETEKQIESASKIFYKQNPWAFLEKKLLEKPGKNIRMVSFKSLGILVLLGYASAGVTGLSYLLGVKPEYLAFVAIPPAIASLISVYFYYKKSIIQIVKNALEDILKKYNPVLNESNEVNSKKYLPKEFHETFDYLHKIYIEKGDLFLEQGGRKVFKNIVDKLVYEIKPAKYVQPVVYY